MRTTHTTWVWRAAAVAAVAIGAACTSSGPAGPSPTSEGPSVGSAAADSLRTPAIKDLPSIGADVATVRAATAKYHDIAAALADGYVLPPVLTCDQSPAGVMGIHVPNPGLMSNTLVEPTRPEVLLYLPTENGFRLVAVEWVVPVIVNGAPWFGPGAPSIAQPPAPQVFGQIFQGWMPGHVPGMPWHWDLHAWVWTNNPDGMFAQWNPSLTCP